MFILLFCFWIFFVWNFLFEFFFYKNWPNPLNTESKLFRYIQTYRHTDRQLLLYINRCRHHHHHLHHHLPLLLNNCQCNHHQAGTWLGLSTIYVWPQVGWKADYQQNRSRHDDQSWNSLCLWQFDSFKPLQCFLYIIQSIM